MNALNIIYFIGAFAIGLLFGMILELFIDNVTLVDLEKQNEKLRLELAEARKQPEVIEIVEPWSVRSKAPEEVSFPNSEGF